MANAVEAQSLSTLIAVADNPPAQRNYGDSWHSQISDLTLYIARVPGSRDVFLTTMKPKSHVVSAQDVQSCLYFCHLDVNEDVERRQSLQLDRHSIDETLSLRGGSRAHPSRGIARKPLPSQSRSAPTSTAQAPPLPHRRPVGPLLQTQETQSSLHFVQSAADCNSDEAARYPRPDLPQDIKTLSEHSAITIIRRDPSSGAQWNSGKITLCKDDLGAKIQSACIDIETYGYQKFKPNPASLGPYGQSLSFDRGEHSRARLSPSKRSSVSSAIPWTAQDAVYDSDHANSQQPFTFQSPWHGHCEFVTGVAGRSVKCHHVPLPHRQPPSELLGLESTVLSELRLNLPAPGALSPTKVSSNNVQRHLKKLANGRTLPRSIPRRSGHGSSSQTGMDSYNNKHTSLMEASLMEAEADDRHDSEEDYEPLDLSLGRESAGGGFWGRRAKLGKLIIQPEGVAMLDLLVAMNMAVWWKMAYQDDHG